MGVYFEWKDEFSVNEETIDTHHKKLIHKLNELMDVILQDGAMCKVEETIDFFESYIHEHFKYEESYMKKMNFPNHEEHVEEHKTFIQKYKEFRENLFSENVDCNQLAFKIESFLGLWLTEHVYVEDQKYAKYARINR
ncbi:MAG: hemerythrin family protein [Patescibacteria group bacterium]